MQCIVEALQPPTTLSLHVGRNYEHYDYVLTMRFVYACEEVTILTYLLIIALLKFTCKTFESLSNGPFHKKQYYEPDF
jgi:hypothetical protein